MIIHSLTFERLLSWKRFVWARVGAGPVLIVGKTGSGKTSICEAVAVALYGKTLHGKLTELINWDSESARIELVLEDQGARYRIARSLHRTRSHATLCVSSAGSQEWKELARGTSAVNKAVVALLGLPFDLFMHAVFFSQDTMLRFLSERDAEQKKLLDVFFGGAFVSTLKCGIDAMLTRVEEKLSACRETLVHVRAAKEYDSARLRAREDLTQFRAEVTHAAGLVQELAAKLDLYDERLRKGSVRVSKYEKQLAVVRSMVEQHTHTLNMLRNNTCPTCQQPTTVRSVTDLKQTLTRQREEYKAERTALLGHLNSVTQAVESLSEQRAELARRHQKAQEVWYACQHKVRHVMESKASVRASLAKAVASIKQVTRELTAMTTKRAHLLLWRAACGSRGMKTFFLQRALPFIEDQTNVYLRALIPFSVTLTVDEETGVFKHNFTSHGGQVGLPSAGQRRCVDFAVCLALFSLMRHITQARVDFMLLDETPVHIDAELSERMAEVVKSLPVKQVLAITHDVQWRRHFTTVMEVTRKNSTSSYELLRM